MNSGTDRKSGTPAPKRRGRRRSGEDTRAALLEAARSVFTEQGYNDATVRSIAATAGVDPAMVNHWFGGKENLFTAAVAIPINPAEVVPRMLEGHPDQLAERIVRQFLTVWDSAGGGGFIALLRSISTHESSVVMIREFITTVVFGRLVQALDVDQPELRAALCGTQIAGLGIIRYAVELEPLASTDHDTVVAAIAPNLQRYLTGDLRG